MIEVMESFKQSNKLQEEERNKVARILIHSLLKHQPKTMYITELILYFILILIHHYISII